MTLEPRARADFGVQELQSKPTQVEGSAAKVATERAPPSEAELPAPGKLIVEKDEQAGRFVQIVLDAQTQEVERRYPSETQLAFSRAVAAYVRAMSES